VGRGKRLRVQNAPGKVPPLSLKEMTSCSASSYLFSSSTRPFFKSLYFFFCPYKCVFSIFLGIFCSFFLFLVQTKFTRADADNDSQSVREKRGRDGLVGEKMDPYPWRWSDVVCLLETCYLLGAHTGEDFLLLQSCLVLSWEPLRAPSNYRKSIGRIRIRIRIAKPG